MRQNTAAGNTPEEKLHRSMEKKVKELEGSTLSFPVVSHDDPFSLLPSHPPYPEG